MSAIPRPIKILIVDDDKKLNRMLEFRLSNAGFMTKAAFDGEEALRILKKESFDLIVLDLVMPKMPGFDVLVEMRRLNIQAPVVVLSMLRQEEDVRRARELGAREYFVKLPSFVDAVVKYAEKISTT
jgi:two-component system alkaline phosphatase synthesis response regulator PhoP